jgi:hypothetical protein
LIFNGKLDLRVVSFSIRINNHVMRFESW